MLSDWQPSCSLEYLQLRANTLSAIRAFFAERKVLEVETPVLANAIGTDPQLDFFTTEFCFTPEAQRLYLQTSPEFAMKRLLASGSGSIYQICKAFRNGEAGRFHNPEFTLLEWYRENFDLNQLMQEIIDLMVYLFKPYKALDKITRISYQEVFSRFTGLDALNFSYQNYIACAEYHKLPEAVLICGQDHSLWLDFLFTHLVQPQFSMRELVLVYGYPACQSSLARINTENPLITDRVEIFINSVELGNGYYELLDSVELERRFDSEIKYRHEHDLPSVMKDQRLLSAMKNGLPDCSGMAIGLDRVLMLLAECSSIEDILSFSISRA